MTHYETLRVVPWAEDAVIRAAYRALMRLYHPDTNHDPEAELRVREITGAFAVLGDSEKRAVYDAFPTLRNEIHARGPDWFTASRRPSWSKRSVGVVSAGAAIVVLSLTIAMWPQSGLRPPQRETHMTPANAKATRSAPPARSGITRSSVDIAFPGTAAVPAAADKHPFLPEQTTHQVIAGASDDSTKKFKRDIVTVSVKSHPPVAMATPIAAQVTAPKATGGAQIANVTRPPAVVASCPSSSSKVGDGDCRDDRQAQVERIAAIFFKQSMEHADLHKQELLLSARTRSAFSRTLCHSSDCVTQTYLREMRDTTEIMQGRVPTPR